MKLSYSVSSSVSPSVSSSVSPYRGETMTKIRPTIKLTKAQAKDVYWVIEDKLARLESDLMYGKILTQDRKRSKVVKWLSNRDKELLAERERLGVVLRKLWKIIKEEYEGKQ